MAPWRLVLAAQSQRLMVLFLWHGILPREEKVDRKLLEKMFSLKVLAGVVNLISISWDHTLILEICTCDPAKKTLHIH